MFDILTVNENIQSIILDKDGTIIDAHHYWIEMSNLRIIEVLDSLNLSDTLYNDLQNKLEVSFGIDKENHKIFKNGPASVKPRNFMVNLILNELLEEGINISEKNVTDAFLKVDELSKLNISNFLKLLPGLEDFISKAHIKGIDLCLVTNDITTRAELALENLGFLNKFKYIFGQDQVQKAKPSKDLAELVIKSGNYSKDCIINIGDHPNDMRMGIDAGIKNNYAVLTGLSDANNFAEIECSLLKDFTQIDFDE